MSQEQVQRIKVIENAVAGRITVREAAEYLNLSERQVKRLKRAYDAADAGWVQHGNQGWSPANAASAETRQRVEDLARGKYGGFNDSHLHQKLTVVEGLVLSRQSVPRILRDAGISSRYERTVGKDHVVTAIPGVTVQLPALASGHGYAGKKVDVFQQPDGDFHIYLNRHLLHIEPALPAAGPVRAHPFRKSSAPRKKKPVKTCSYAGRPAI